jgi:hypothetical protein
LRVRFGIAFFAIFAVAAPVFAEDNIPLSTIGIPSTCKVFPNMPLSEASGEYPKIRCEWLSPVRVEEGIMKGGTAGVDTFDQLITYDIMKSVQQEYASAFLDQPDTTVEDKSNIIDCVESRMVVWSVKGTPTLSHFTALCGGIGINFATTGADFTEDNAERFAQIVRSIIDDKLKK